MKKLLSIIGAISIAGSGASAVIACSSSDTTSDQQKADAIKDKITTTNILVAGDTNPDTSKSGTTITKALEAVNTGLEALISKDKAKLAYSKATLPPGISTKVQLTITVGSKNAFKSLSLTLTKTPANTIAYAIKTTDLTVDGDTDTDTSKPETIAEITKKLEAANSTLTALVAENHAKLNYSKTTLVRLEPVKITLTINADKSSTATKALNVTLDGTDQDKVNAIKKKITSSKILTIDGAVGLDPTTDDAKKAISAALKWANPSLTLDDLTHLSYTGGPLTSGAAVKLTINIKVGSASNNEDTVQVISAKSDQQTAEALREKISVFDLTVPVGTNTDVTTPAAKTAINTALQTENPTVTNDDLSNFSYSGTLVVGKTEPITATIKFISSNPIEITLNITLLQ